MGKVTGFAVMLVRARSQGLLLPPMLVRARSQGLLLPPMLVRARSQGLLLPPMLVRARSQGLLLPSHAGQGKVTASLPCWSGQGHRVCWSVSPMHQHTFLQLSGCLTTSHTETRMWEGSSPSEIVIKPPLHFHAYALNHYGRGRS